ncbi:hypothetical protein PV04_03401 [Phialophora macrospora]|uniref:Uncharacterized protein n=1 Tax=Phialophora macrospora TaxID=1851006 RepID=A0A0D2FXL3_9EURO|nr:hypothetical protein PV04_03401 [Phialophora macrospora]
MATGWAATQKRVQRRCTSKRRLIAGRAAKKCVMPPPIGHSGALYHRLGTSNLIFALACDMSPPRAARADSLRRVYELHRTLLLTVCLRSHRISTKRLCYCFSQLPLREERNGLGILSTALRLIPGNIHST